VVLRRTDYDVDAKIQALRIDDPNRELREQWISARTTRTQSHSKSKRYWDAKP
jgi:hypothetical protein